MAGVSKDYYLGIAEDLSEEEIEVKCGELRELCKSVGERN